MADLLAPILVAETVLFIMTMALASRASTRTAGEYVGTAFHLLLLPIIAMFPIGIAGQGAGIAWIACDVVASTGFIWTARDRTELGSSIFTAVRMAGHLLAAVWIAWLSLGLGGVVLPIGIALALGFAAYTLAAGRLPQKALAVPGLLMVVWLLLLARSAAQ